MISVKTVDHKVIMEVTFTVCKITLETWDGICEDVIKFTDITTIIYTLYK